ncbi:MAG: hypothetical protein IKV92_03805 [Akkermansia sp.]|nr:hypothetical protein [Akkermansia sp.]
MKNCLPYVVLMLLCFLSSCRSLVSSNFGACLDAVGRQDASRLEYAACQPFYEMDGRYYAHVRLKYASVTPQVWRWLFTSYDESTTSEETGDYSDGYLLMSPADVATHLARHVEVPPVSASLFIPEGKFDLAAAKHLPQVADSRMLYVKGMKDKDEYGLNLLTFTYCKKSPYQGVPVKRTLSNYARTPLVLLLSYGVDAPITLVSSVVCGAVAAPIMYLGFR